MEYTAFSGFNSNSNKGYVSTLDLMYNGVEKDSVNLENGIQASQCIATTEESEMAILRQRVLIGFNDDGSEIFKHLQASSIDELNEKIVRTYIESGKINDFLNAPDTKQSKTETNFKEFVENWMAVYKENKLKHKTLSTYSGFLKTHLYPTFGDSIVEDIIPDDIQRFLNERKHLSKKTQKEHLALLRQILNHAVKRKLIDENPAFCDDISIPSEKVTERKSLKSQQYFDIINSLTQLKNADDRRMLALFLYTGMRRGEVLGLRWQDIDLKNMKINVVQNVTHKGNRPFVGTLKTKASKRSLPLTNELIELLQPMKDIGYIVGGVQPISISAYDYRLDRISRQINLYGATAHVLRHTYLTHLAGAGIDLKTLQYIAGHAQIQTTMNIYVHAQEENITQAGNLFTSLVNKYSQAG